MTTPFTDIKKICLVRTSALGDTVHALGLVNAIKKRYPKAHLTWILQTIPHEMVKHQPNVDRFITFDRNGGIDEWLRLIRLVRQDHYDLAIIPQASTKASLITLFLRADIRLGFDFHRSREFHWLVTNEHIEPRPVRHVQDQFFDFAEHLGIKNHTAEWNFRFTAEEYEWQRSFFAAIDRPAIGFIIASTHPEKDWDPAGYARVMDHVDRKLDLQPLIIGGPSAGERELSDRISSLCRCKPVVALGRSIRRAMLRIAGTRMIVSPDTGPLHIAVALGVPTIGLYGYTNPRRCGPYRKFSDLLIDKYNIPDTPEIPITRKTLPGRTKTIKPVEVIEKIELGLEKYGRKSDSPLSMAEK